LESDPTLGLELPGETSNLDMDYHIQTPEDVEKTKAPNQTFYVCGTVVYADIFSRTASHNILLLLESRWRLRPM